MKKYNPKLIEKKWQKYWESHKTFEVTEDKDKEKFYSLIEFPYPSGEGLHVGHPRPFTAMDVISRKKRMDGKNVLFPIGFDSFGLPTENYAIKTGKQPAEVTKKNIANFTRQLKMLGYSFDWSRTVDTSNPKYYKWTQWLFLQFFKHGLAYKKNQPINWCPKDKIGLANEEVVNGCCERCGTPVEKRNKEQWMLAITKYADKLLAGLKNVDYIERARVQQENWIGRSEGALIHFVIASKAKQSQSTGGTNNGIAASPLAPRNDIEVFTTRPDTIFGATFVAISAELAKKWLDGGWEASEEVKKYIEETIAERAAATTREEMAKTGVDAGVKAVNPATKKEVPVWITNYVLGEVGTGAIMGVPAHDERDYEFAKKFGLPIVEVVRSKEQKPKYLIFDFDGVLGDTYEASIVTRLKMGDVKNREEAVESINQYFSRKPNHTRGHNLSEEEVKKNLEWTQKFGEHMAKINFPLFDEFVGLVKNIPNTKIAVISAGSGLYMRERSQQTGLNPTHVLSFEDHHSKEEKIEMVCKDWGIKVSDVYYFTDSKADVYELENFMDRKKLIGCAWGYCGYDALRELLPEDQVLKESTDINKIFGTQVFTESGELVNSGQFSGMDSKKAKSEIIEFVGGKPQVQFKLRDWVFSRQRYWGEPIPLVNCPDCGWVPLPESELPLELPKVKKYQPTDTGESPLAAMEKWVNTKCPKCGGPAKRETDTMPNWAGSSWYYLAYALGGQKSKIKNQNYWNQELLKYWMPVDWYNGGMEHVVLHLLYSRFWNIFLHDIGLVPHSEPYAKRTAHGMILSKGGEKMSKSKGNVVNPDEMVEKFGADALRTYIMFMGPFDQAVEWDTNGVVGVKRFLDRVWLLQDKLSDSNVVILNKVKDPSLSDKRDSSVTPQNDKLTTLLHQTIQKVGDDIEAMRFNTAIAKMMELVNEMSKQESILLTHYSSLLKILSPFAPHMCEELWNTLGNNKTLVYEPWPEYNLELTKESTMTLAVQINGKVRDEIKVAAEMGEEEITKLALAGEKVQKWLDGKEPKKIIYVKGKLVSIVV